MPRTSTKAVPTGYDDTVPSLAGVKNAVEAARLLPFDSFSPQADGYIMNLIETWCDRNPSQAAHELRFVLEQAKWAVGWKAVGRAFLDQLPL